MQMAPNRIEITNSLLDEIKRLQIKVLGLVCACADKDDEIERLRAVLEAMRGTVYEQPIGVWFYAIDSVLEKKPHDEPTMHAKVD
jgi:hypothetical protein